MVGICTALAQGGGADPLTVVTLRTVGTVLLFLLWFRIAGVPLALPPRERVIAVAIGVPLCVNNYLLNLAIAEIPVPLVVLLFYLWPAITTAVSWLTGRERFGWMRLAGLVARVRRRRAGAQRRFHRRADEGRVARAGRRGRLVGDLPAHQPFLPRARPAAGDAAHDRHRRRDIRGGCADLRHEPAATPRRLGRRDRRAVLLCVRDDRPLHRDRAPRADARRLLHEFRADRRGDPRGADPGAAAGAGAARGRRAGGGRAVPVPAA